MNTQLTVIIPCYNCENTLKEAVESCYTQGFEADEFEIVMTDDNSTDQTRAVMEKLKSEHSNISTFSHEKNKGGGATRNTCVEHAQSDVIYCLDSDDVLPAGTIRTMLEYLQENGYDGVANQYTRNFNGTDQEDIHHTVTMAYAGETIPFESLLEKNNRRCGLYQVFMFTKVAFLRAGGYPTNHGFDTQGFAWRFLAAGLKSSVCPGTSYLQRINYKESYYLSEYNQGKANHNWQEILREHIRFFKPEVKEMILNFNCSDFTKNLFEEVRAYENPFISDIYSQLGKKDTNIPIATFQKVIPRRSLTGLYLRIKKRLL